MSATAHIDPARQQRDRRRLFAVLAGLYLAQGIPTYLFAAALPAILREQGVSRTAIGMLSLLMLPLILKFLWAPQVDRIRPFAKAHRAGWVCITQCGMVATFLAMTMIAPTDVGAIFAFGFVAGLLLSTQDIATDGYAAKYLAPEDRPIGNAIQGGAVALGVVVGGSGGLLLYDSHGWVTTVTVMAAFSAVPLAAALFMREGDAGTAGAPVARPSIRRFLRRPGALQVLWIALVYRASEGMVKSMEGPYLVDAGVPLDIIGYLSGGAALTVGLGGSALAALLLRRHGSARVLAALGGVRTVCFAIFALHALGAVPGIGALFGASFLQTLIRYMEIVALYSLFMSVTSSDQPGTDFTLLACAQLIVYLIGSMLAGRLADMLGYDTVFSLATAISALAVIVTWKTLSGSRNPAAGAAEVEP
ncbi:RhtX/FptX family siderophore transporter [Pseudochelatococcus sp. B33]